MRAQREVCSNCRKFKSGDTVGSHEGIESGAIHRKRSNRGSRESDQYASAVV